MKKYISEAPKGEFPYGLITPGRDSSISWYLVAREYPGKQMEATAMRLDADETLRRGGGAKRKHNKKDEMDETTLRKSKQRAVVNVRRRCMAIRVDRMLTLTTRKCITDFTEFAKIFAYFVKLMHKRYSDKFAYVAVPELQERGAIHYHLAIRGYFSVRVVRELWNRACGNATDGNIDVTSPKKYGKNSWNPRRVAQYISKYITKDETVGFNKRRYSTGGTIPEPVIHRGYIAPGLYLPKLFRELFNHLVDRHPSYLYESEETHRPLIYGIT